MKSFSFPDPDFVGKISGKLVNHNNSNYIDKVVAHEGKHWIIKESTEVNSRKREYLTFLLGKNLVNLTEIKVLNQEDLTTLLNMGFAIDLNSHGTFLTRIVHDYSQEELPLKELDSAVAGELVFSTWIRRRDSHEFNREYIEEDIPIFFDHGVAFQGNKDANIFFSEQGKGFAGSWRVFKINEASEIKSRFRKDNWGDNHFIYDFENFSNEVRRQASLINFEEQSLKEIISQAEFEGSEAENLKSMLLTTQGTLAPDVEKLFETVINHQSFTQ